MDDIGYNDGITAYEDWFRKLSPAIDKYNAWTDTFNVWALGARTTSPPIPPKFPKIPLEGPNFNESDMSTWPWPRKFFRNTMRKLKDYFDAVNNPTPPPPTPPPPPPPPATKRYAPRTHNLGGRDQDPRFCMKSEYGVKRTTHPTYGNCYEDEMGCFYDIDHGLNLDGRRDRNFMVAGLKGADSMDGAEPCDPYSANGISVPPYPGDPYAQTGSYHQ